VTGLRGWTPVRVGLATGRPVIEWCWTDGITFDHPFFDQSVDRCLRDPYRLLFRKTTSIEELGEWAQASPGLPLGGLVLHMSRCGSTLVTQMLAARGDVRVMSEPGPLDTLMRADAPLAERADWLRWMVSALGQPELGEQRLVVKLDAWAALDLAALDAAFPDAPRVFLIRDAAEVLVSQAGHRGYHMIPGTLPPAVVGLEPADVMTMSPDAYGAAVLGAIVASVVAGGDDPRWLVVPYEELPSAVTERIAGHFGLWTTPDQASAMAAASRRDAKNPVLDFTADGGRKRAAATPEMLQEAEVRVEPFLKVLRDRLQRPQPDGSGMPDRVLLPLRFDTAALAADALALDESAWIPHFNAAYYQGDWSGAALRAVGGRSDTIYPDPAAVEPWADTPLLARCPAIAAALARLECELTSVRLLRLGPGASVREHRDHALGFEDGECRLHVPVVSGPEAEFVLSGAPIPMADGDCWYVNVNNAHSVANHGDAPRIHLVIDVIVNDWLTAALQAGILGAEVPPDVGA
jgi:hypothetical protein